LIRGEIIEMPLPGSQHAGRVNRLTRLFTSRFGETVVVSIQNPASIDEWSEPVPDVALLKPRPDFYDEAFPIPDDVLLFVEVSFTSTWYDTRIKAPLYAAAGIPEYWVLNIKKDILEVRSRPVNGQYGRLEEFSRGQAIAIQGLPAVTFLVDEILG
jgi:Uma2 family endonuclease